jgi:hypothetical protein
MRSIDDPNHVNIDLELDQRSAAEALQTSLLKLWEEFGDSSETH